MGSDPSRQVELLVKCPTLGNARQNVQVAQMVARQLVITLSGGVEVWRWVDGEEDELGEYVPVDPREDWWRVD